MTRLAARLGALACAGVLSCGCAQRNEARAPQNADERLADAVMERIERSDMHPVVTDFVPARKSVLLDPAHVKTMHDYVAGAGDFVGARTIRTIARIDGRTVYLTAYFANGQEPVAMILDESGKVVHYSIGQL